jgi:hypothetical protein
LAIVQNLVVCFEQYFPLLRNHLQFVTAEKDFYSPWWLREFNNDSPEPER